MARMEPDLTTVGNLPLPKRLVTLIEAGLWPRTQEQEMRQNIRSLVSKERIKSFAPDQDEIYLVRPPFSTVATLIAHGDQFWSRFGALEQIAPELSIYMGNFGLGSDSPILLDYRRDISSPVVIRLKLNPQLGEMMPDGRRKLLGWANAWLRCADTFEAFADMLGLDRAASS